MSMLILYQKKRAAIDWSFLSSLPSYLTYARASSGTYFGVDGLLKTAADNEPRFEYDPVTHEPLGLLLEQQITNSLPRSQDITAWGQTGSPTRTNNESGAPDGSDTWNRFTRTTTSPSYISRSVIKSAASTPAVLSFYAKKGSVGNYVAARIQGAYPNRVDTVFNLDAGTTGSITIGGSGFSGTSSGIKHIGNGVYRCWVAISTSDTKDTFYIALSANSTGSTQVDATDTAADSNAYFWGMQVELNSMRPSSYIPTIDTPVTRAADSLSTTNISWFNATQGAVVVQFIIPNQIQTASQLADMGSYQICNIQANLKAGTYSPALYTTNTYPINSIGKAGFSYNSSSRALCLNGGVVASSIAAPTFGNTLCLGHTSTVSQHLNGYLRAFKYYNRALSSSELQRITI